MSKANKLGLLLASMSLMTGTSLDALSQEITHPTKPRKFRTPRPRPNTDVKQEINDWNKEIEKRNKAKRQAKEDRQVALMVSGSSRTRHANK